MTNPALEDNSNPTIDYYRKNAAQYFLDTLYLDSSQLRERFLSFVPHHGHIVDLGCGSGRDSRYFLDYGFRVTAVDACEELAALAEKVLGQKVMIERIEDFSLTEAADAIWACASLLHIPKVDLKPTLIRLKGSLKVGGIIYATFKYGDQERAEGQRRMTDLNEQQAATLIESCDGFRVIDQWITDDVRPDKKDSRWLNLILQRVS